MPSAVIRTYSVALNGRFRNPEEQPDRSRLAPAYRVVSLIKARRTGIQDDEKQAFEQFLLTRSSESFCALYKVLYPQVRRYFLARGFDEMVAEELAQNVMFIVYERIGDLRNKELFYGWLFKIARNELLQFARQRQRRNRIAEFEPLDEEVAARMTTEMDFPANSRFLEWVSQLEPREREIIMLRFIDELSYEELAMALGLPLGTVKSRIFNAKKKLAQIVLIALSTMLLLIAMIQS